MRLVTPIGTIAAPAWSVAIALAVTALWTPRWWHPDCALREDGPNAHLASFPFPFPFAEPSVATSLEWFISPGLLAIDLFLIAVAVLPLALIGLRRLAGWAPIVAKVLSAKGIAAAALAIAVWVLFFAIGAFRPTAGIGDYTGRTRPWNIMPAVLAEALGKPACTR
ncbi:MAG: hypothetical protein Q8L23_08835 [Caulobacter sp.]|nr:hypothetical protein [Caulobacter sp.]